MQPPPTLVAIATNSAKVTIRHTQRKISQIESYLNVLRSEEKLAVQVGLLYEVIIRDSYLHIIMKDTLQIFFVSAPKCRDTVLGA